MHSCQIKFSSHVINLISGSATTDEINAYYYGCISDINMQEYAACSSCTLKVPAKLDVPLLIDKTVGV